MSQPKEGNIVSGFNNKDGTSSAFDGPHSKIPPAGLRFKYMKNNMLLNTQTMQVKGTKKAQIHLLIPRVNAYVLVFSRPVLRTSALPSRVLNPKRGAGRWRAHAGWVTLFQELSPSSNPEGSVCSFPGMRAGNVATAACSSVYKRSEVTRGGKHLGSGDVCDLRERDRNVWIYSEGGLPRGGEGKERY